MPKVKKTSSPPFDYICRECGIELDGKGSVCTVHQGTCTRCGKSAPVSHVYDWSLDGWGKRINVTSEMWD